MKTLPAAVVMMALCASVAHADDLSIDVDLPAVSADGKTIALPLYYDESADFLTKSHDVVFAPVGKADGKRLVIYKNRYIGVGPKPTSAATQKFPANVEAVNNDLAKGRFDKTGFSVVSDRATLDDNVELEVTGQESASLAIKVLRKGKRVGKRDLVGTNLQALIATKVRKFVYVQVRDSQEKGTQVTWYAIAIK